MAKFAAETLAGALAVNVVVTAEIHWDKLDDARIQTVVANTKSLVNQLIKALKR
jgi:type VI protein secretion system component VasA